MRAIIKFCESWDGASISLQLTFGMSNRPYGSPRIVNAVCLGLQNAERIRVLMMVVIAVILPLEAEDPGRSLTARAIENRTGIDKIRNDIAQSHLITRRVYVDVRAQLICGAALDRLHRHNFTSLDRLRFFRFCHSENVFFRSDNGRRPSNHWRHMRLRLLVLRNCLIRARVNFSVIFQRTKTSRLPVDSTMSDYGTA